MTPVDLPPQPPIAAAEVHYGGPDKKQGALRDLLVAKVDATPPGGEIIWATYYFRDQDLANDWLRPGSAAFGSWCASRAGLAVGGVAPSRGRGSKL